ncbi:Quinone oxidoreductase 1 [Chlamydia abortus]|uniref:NAD(P)H-quinone oxidoreductase n=1 Tax=Paenibacillus residui TaxID=629724 RepID=A0ABW3D8I5_9BACL|nr:NAD(P)H-quinone oxidoreductase [Paenibacillus sp. 32O-W]SHE12411.1 Quinone oxidoreductase 1 [Chlamydia abortus]
MKAVWLDPETRLLKIREWEDPVLEADGLIVQVKATALNRADLMQKRGLYPPPKGASPILGLEMAGEVVQVGGSVKDWKPGDRVFALLPGGGYAEKVSIPAGMAMPIPDGWSYEQAAAVPEVFLTAYLNLFMLGGLREGSTVLIHAGASGVGSAAIQLVREAGAVSIVTAGSPEKLEACLRLGAHKAINYKEGPFAPQVKEATGGLGVDLILDLIGASYFEQNLDCLAVNGRLVLIGLMGGSHIQNLDLNRLLMRRIQLIGSTLRSRPVTEKIELTRQFNEFASRRFAEGRMQPVIDSVWELEQVNEAHERMERNENIGKIVLRTPW